MKGRFSMKQMITIGLDLANQLFQVARGYGVAEVVLQTEVVSAL
jgi:hypothetical protein